MNAAGPWIRCSDRLPEVGLEVIGAWPVNLERDQWDSMVTHLMEAVPEREVYGVVRGEPRRWLQQSREAAGDVARAIEAGDDDAANEARWRVAEALGQ